MKKYFVFSDVHSNYDALMTALDEAGFDINNNEHCIISCGDLLDRGGKTIECLKFVNSLPDDRKILIEGNHEDLLRSLCSRRIIAWYDTHNGTDKTLTALAEDTKCYHDDLFKDDVYEDCWNNPKLKKYRDSLLFYFESPKHIFVHGWIPVTTASWYGKGDWRDVAEHRSAWFNNEYGSAWENGMNEWRNGKHDSQGKTIVCGHYHSNWGHRMLHNEHNITVDIYDLLDNKDKMEKDEWNKIAKEATRPFEDEGIVSLDACTVISDRVNVYVINEEDM